MVRQQESRQAPTGPCQTAPARQTDGSVATRAVPISPRPNGEREGPAPQAREGEGDAPLSRCRLKQTWTPIHPLTFPSLTRWVPSSPLGERRKGASSPNAIALPLRGEG